MFDVAVVGLGAMGSAAAWHLARRGLRVLGLERFGPAHDRGSSHGRTRVIRQAYFEHPDYVPLLLRTYELWRELERESGSELYRKTGAFHIGAATSPVVAGSLESARRHSLPHRVLTAADLARRFPFMRFRPEDVALEEFEAGALFAEDGLLAFQEGARRRGAELRFDAPVRSLDEIPAAKLVLTAGPWMRDFLPALPLRVERQVLFWFDPPPEPTPLFVWDRGPRVLYSIPDMRQDGVKVAFHHGGETTTADSIRRDVSDDEVGEMRRALAETMPALDRPPRRASVCMYTNTPDEHFAIGAVPGRAGACFASACSGHGFKFAPVVGEILADLVAGGRAPSLFSADRFA
jgi:sarcosine oxidase